ncbi:hypothetical protein M8818_005870 [Zalaria obscura]|uniref:Uncharacterized protein n=1 Tax=Zalaria obscura TaxID=2024903 RepID=A0ACC3SC06_9PEZI
MLVVHHLQVSQSERIVWLCEELGIDYELKLHKRDPIFSPKSIKDLHPLGAAPIIQDGDLTLAESPACVEYIIHIHGSGRLALPPSHKDYAKYLYWFHFANGTLQPAISRLLLLQSAKLDKQNDIVRRTAERMSLCLEHMDKHLAKGNTWLAGDEFSAADILTVFTLTTMRSFYPLDLSPYHNILAYLQRVGKREAYTRAHEKGDPGLEYMLEGPPPDSFFSKLGGKL